MCGITGFVNYKKDITNEKNILIKMTNTLKKRGPDQYGYYTSLHSQLGHRRLTVVDPTGGLQPMEKHLNKDRYVIVYNGELYNTEDLRLTLKQMGYAFSSYSDTEVLLTSYIAWGPECVKKINGIYAFGIWDEKEETLFLARDPLGVKPLYYTFKDDYFIFGSELKALLEHPVVEPILDEVGICEIMGLGPAHSLDSGVFKNINQLPPAYSLLYSKDDLRTEEFWKLQDLPHTETEEETSEHVRFLLLDAITRQLGADVPVCTFLSGGLDSSIISTVAANEFKKSGKTLETFSIDYDGNKENFKSNSFQPTSDDEWVDKMVDFIGSKHHKVILDNKDLVFALEEAVEANDLPGMADIDSSLLLFCNKVRKQATVALSGDSAKSMLFFHFFCNQ